MSLVTISATDRRFTQQQYELIMWASLVIGIIGYLIAVYLEYPMAALGIYWAGFIAFIALWKGSSVTMSDERDEAIERRTGSITIGVIAVILLVIGPTIPALRDAGYEVPDIVFGMLFGYVGMFVVWSIVYIAIRFGPSSA